MLYLRIGALVAFLAVASLALWYRSEATQAAAERDMARADLQLAEAANAAQQAAIGRLQAEKAKSDQIVAQMAEDLDAIRQATDETNDAIGDLKETNADVEAYLRSAVPDELRKLLNH